MNTPTGIKDIRDDSANSEDSYRNLWCAFIFQKTCDACGQFAMPHSYGFMQAESFERQYQEKRQYYITTGHRIISRKQLQRVPIGGVNTCTNARAWIVDGLTGACDILGYGEGFIEETYNTVQKAITLEKKLYDEFKREAVT